MKATYLDTLRDMKANNNYDLGTLTDLAKEIESSIGPDKCWNTILPAFSTDKLLENLYLL